jgi:hypothetical protein
MKRHRMILFGIIVVAAVAGGLVVAWARRGPAGHADTAARASYYCPMHPTYASDRPGTCPICNMSLVKRSPEPSAETEGASSTSFAPAKHERHARDICIMHNCPMERDGKPCPMMVVAKDGELVTCPICGTHVSTGGRLRKVLYWTDPMIPGDRSDKPGRSPMGMERVPVYEEDDGSTSDASTMPDGYAEILVTPQKQQLIGVKAGADQNDSDGGHGRVRHGAVSSASRIPAGSAGMDARPGRQRDGHG